MIHMSHPRVKLLILVNDPYDWMFLLKIQRMIGAMPKNLDICGTKNIAIKANDAFPSSKDFSDFFKNKSNKIRLQQFLRAQFIVEAKTVYCDVIYSIQDECCSLVAGQRKKHLEFFIWKPTQ